MKEYYIVIDDEESFVIQARDKPAAIITAINEYWSRNKDYVGALTNIEVFSITKIIPEILKS